MENSWFGLRIKKIQGCIIHEQTPMRSVSSHSISVTCLSKVFRGGMDAVADLS